MASTDIDFHHEAEGLEVLVVGLAVLFVVLALLVTLIGL